MSDYTPFQLAASLSGHEQDVKAVCSAGEDGVISAARDNSVRMWFRTASNAFGNSKIFLGHSRFVNSVAYIGPSAEYPSGLIVSGSSDKIIHVWDVENAGDPIFSLIDHADNVCALDITPSGHIVSGSWDKTSKLWRNQQLVYTLKGHEAAVWAVLAISDQIIITGSADKTIVRWDDGVRTNTFYGHTDCVRSLAEIKGMGFVSCSNDGSLRIWNLDGQCLQELYGHQSFVYSVDTLPTGEIISSGEDRSVKVWKDGECVQTISHPAISVWCTAAMPNGDIISGASDGIVRVFSRVPERIADAEKLKEYNELLASQAIPTNQVGDLKRDNLPGKEALSTPGEREGQVLMVKDGIKVEAYQ
ncbi:7248_t:CDS:10, partial [Paraglomus occultum]